jgi:hypothetical protein
MRVSLGNLHRQTALCRANVDERHETDPTNVLPRKLRETIDSIRNFGNFSAHPTTRQVIDVTPTRRNGALR